MVSRWAGRQIHYLASDGFPIVRMSLSLAGDSRQTHYLALAAVLLAVNSTTLALSMQSSTWLRLGF